MDKENTQLTITRKTKELKELLEIQKNNNKRIEELKKDLVEDKEYLKSIERAEIKAKEQFENVYKKLNTKRLLNFYKTKRGSYFRCSSEEDYDIYCEADLFFMKLISLVKEELNNREHVNRDVRK